MRTTNSYKQTCAHDCVVQEEPHILPTPAAQNKTSRAKVLILLHPAYIVLEVDRSTNLLVRPAKVGRSVSQEFQCALRAVPDPIHTINSSALPQSPSFTLARSSTIIRAYPQLPHPPPPTILNGARLSTCLISLLRALPPDPGPALPLPCIPAW